MHSDEPQPRARPTRRGFLIGSVITANVLVAALLAFGLTRDPGVVGSPLIGRPAPEFVLRTLDGSRIIALSDLRGQVVVVNFWASWCAACREEHPNLLAAWNRYRDHGVVLVGIDYQDTTVAAMSFMREMGGDWPVVSDPASQTALAYGVYGVPETFFISPAGLVVDKKVGASSYQLLTDEIERLLHDDGG